MTMNKMSQAAKTGRAPRGKPMSRDAREGNYELDDYSGHPLDVLTGPQKSRIRHKAGHALSVARREAAAAAEAEAARKRAQADARNARRREAYAAAKAAKQAQEGTAQ